MTLIWTHTSDTSHEKNFLSQGGIELTCPRLLVGCGTLLYRRNRLVITLAGRLQDEQFSYLKPADAISTYH